MPPPSGIRRLVPEGRCGEPHAALCCPAHLKVPAVLAEGWKEANIRIGVLQRSGGGKKAEHQEGAALVTAACPLRLHPPRPQPHLSWQRASVWRKLYVLQAPP